ncbi:SusC/RagA family TonB-linked outer membrane protein [Sphingobacterium paucimobilis]|uniref:TonB-dependent receptor plug domain-containing protein n=1 Tax=Sphingobacterium paucimobilis HER1398 TaxID=1346330 RepID=U2H7E7_9SPHI|nr:SusC/RagA family TonB-linked outer membrane protein [Sphingobacterium paucimobilis]ERJ57616.1 hypothetical protein M472_02435 [Sphingobacterium paucimobilis HER1398]
MGLPFGKFTSRTLLAALLSIQSFGRIEAQTVTVRENNVPIQQVLNSLRKQYGLDILGDITLVRNAKKVSINMVDKPIEQVLKKLAAGQSFELELDQKTILVKPENGIISQKTKRSIESSDMQQRYYNLVGTVTDEGGNVLAGVTVKLLNSTNWASVTSDDGSYSVQVVEDGEVQFSMVGYESQIIKVAGRNHINVRLKRADNVMDEAVVTGYGTRKRESFTGATTTVTRQDLEKFNNRNIFSIIQSLDPAFKIAINNEQGSNPNALPEITIRGTNMVGEYAVNAPLVIMDGFESSMQRVYDLDVNRIESITLLKDASATALYGSRGGNGVLVIETRLPKDGKFTVGYDIRSSSSFVDLSDYSLMNSFQKLEYEKLVGVYDNANLPMQSKLIAIYESKYLDAASGVNTDWLFQPVQSKTSFDHSVRVEGGNDRVRYSIDGSYGDTKGVIKESGRQRSGAGFNLMYRVPQKFTFRNHASFQSSKAYESPYGDFSTYAQMNPYYRIHDGSGNLIKVYNLELAQLVGGSDGPSLAVMEYNPLYDAQLPYLNERKDINILNNLSLEWYPIQSLQITANANVNKSISKYESFTSPNHSQYYGETDPTIKGAYTQDNSDGFGYSGNMRINYAQTFGKNVLNAMILGEISGRTFSSVNFAVTGYTDDDFISPRMATKYSDNLPIYVNSNDRLVGSLLNLNYTYDGRLVLEGTLRRDGSSKFGENKRFTGYWSTGVAYNLHREKFIEQTKIVDLFRVFGNYGISGSESFSKNMTATAYTIPSDGTYVNQGSLRYESEGNPDLRWPKIYSLSGGIEVGLWNNVLNLRFNAYSKKTTNMVSTIKVAPSIGLNGQNYYENLGEVVNKGFEGYANIKVLNLPEHGMSLYLNGSAAYNVNRLSKISEELKQLNELTDQEKESGSSRPISQKPYYQEGESLSTLRGVRSLGIDPASGRELFVDLDGNKTFIYNADDIQIIGVTDPKLFGGFGASFNYYRLSVSAFFNYSIGADTYNSTLVGKVENADPHDNVDTRVWSDRWKNPGDRVMFKDIRNTETTKLSSRFVQKESYFHLSSINVNYDVTGKWIDRYKIQRLQLNFSTNDLFKLSTVKMERGTGYPFARTFNFGLSIQY